MEGEELTIHRFPTHSIGLASPLDLQPQTANEQVGKQNLWQQIKNFFAASDLRNVAAVCVPPGARLILKSIPDGLQHKCNVRKEEIVSFLQTGMEANTYRDAILFTNGCQVLLQELSEGIPVRVVSLDAIRGSRRNRLLLSRARAPRRLRSVHEGKRNF